MGEYTMGKAPKRDSYAELTSPVPDLESDGARTNRAASSKLAQFTKPAKRVIEPSTTKHPVGNQVRVQKNNVGTGVFKDALNSYQRATSPATENPDGERARLDYRKKAAGKVARPRP